MQIDFTDVHEMQQWSVLNDGVMGGVSQGGIKGSVAKYISLSDNRPILVIEKSDD